MGPVPDLLTWEGIGMISDLLGQEGIENTIIISQSNICEKIYSILILDNLYSDICQNNCLLFGIRAYKFLKSLKKIFKQDQGSKRPSI